MRNDQIKIKYVKYNKCDREWLYPKSYVFKLTSKDKKEFKDQLQKGKKGLIEISKCKMNKVSSNRTSEVKKQREGNFMDEL